MAKLVVHLEPSCSPVKLTATTAALVGVPSHSDVAAQRRAIKKLLTQVGAVALDVADLRIQHGPAVKMLSDALLAAGGWPAARLAVVQPDGRLAAALEANGVSQDVHVAGSLGCALAMLKNRPMRVSRRAWLRPNSSARQQSRAVINAVCREWNVPHLVCSAVMVTDELVDNVIEVARTPSVFKVSLDGDGLRIALRDFQSPRGTQPELKSVERRSLDHAISAISDSFGITPLSDGKAVWVVLKDGVAK